MIVEKNNLKLLADELIKEIKERKNPFETYTIIVPNLLLEQWFKSYWLLRSNAVLMNVEFKRLRPFLNEAFNNTGKELISSDMLATLIMKELYENKKEYKEFGNYIINKDSINSINLYDLAKNLAKIFISYEMDEFIPDGEQKKLLDEIKAKYSNYVFLSDILKNKPVSKTKTFVFGFRNIEKAYLKALENLNCTIYLQVVNDNNSINNIYSCASKEREIEYIHGEICKLLESDEKIYDIIVYAPNLTEYESTIKKVFSTGGNKDYPEVPYIILNSQADSSNAQLAINVLYNVLCMNQFTRYDLLKLLTNSNIQKARNIDNSKIEAIIEALDKMNVYRDNIKSDEWLYGIKRLLVSKLVGDSFNIENKVYIGDEPYLPYGSIQADDEAIVTLASIIEDITEFRNKFKDKKIYNKQDLEDLKQELNKWLFYSETEPNFYYNAALKAIDNFIENEMEVPFEIVFLTMIDSAKSISVYPSNMITGGVTFINYKEDNIVSSKHMFFIGMSSNNLPRRNIKDELDLRNDVESLAKIDRDVFKMLMNNASNTYATYLNINLQTLEDYKPSDLLNALEGNIPRLGLLETRKYSNLYTRREIEKKDYNIGLINSEELDIKENLYLPKMEYPSIVKYKDMATFIIENLMFKMNILFDDYDNSLEISTKEYEPIELDNLTKSNIKKEFFLKMIENEGSELNDDIINEILEKYRLTHAYPYCCKEEDIEKLISETKKHYDDLGSSFELKDPFELELNTNIDSNTINWKLICNSNYIICNENSKITFNYSKVKKIEKVKDFAELYIISLAYIAGINDNNDYVINLCNSKIKAIKDFSINKAQAINILNELYRGMYDYDDVKFRTFDVCYKASFDDIFNVEFGGVWEYFDDKNLVNVKEAAGYEKKEYESTEDNNIRNELIKFYKDNVLYVNIKEEEGK